MVVNNGGVYPGFNLGEFLGEDTEVIETDKGNYINYEVSSSIISPEFSKILTDGKLVIPSVVPSNESEAYMFAQATIGSEYFVSVVDYNKGIFDIEYYKYETNTREKHRVEAVYTGCLDDTTLTKAKYYVENIPLSDNGWAYFDVIDLETINMWVNGFNGLNGILNYSGELKKYLENSNMNFQIVRAGGGDSGELFSSIFGTSVVSNNGVICDAVDCVVSGTIYNVIYVPTETEKTPEVLMAAAQKRINEYLGDSNKAVITYGGEFNTLTYVFPVIHDLEIMSEPDDYFIVTVNDNQHKILIIPDSSKMVNPVYKTVDIASNISVTSNTSDIPLDTCIYASKLTDGTIYNDIIDKLDIGENVTYDLKLYSCSQEKYISSLENNKFVVSIPIPNSLKGKELMAYYIDDNSKVINYDVNIVDDNAVFETDHFSIYTIAEMKKDVSNPNAGDNMSFTLMIVLLCTSIFVFGVYKKKLLNKIE